MEFHTNYNIKYVYEILELVRRRLSVCNFICSLKYNYDKIAIMTDFLGKNLGLESDILQLNIDHKL